MLRMYHIYIIQKDVGMLMLRDTAISCCYPHGFRLHPDGPSRRAEDFKGDELASIVGHRVGVIFLDQALDGEENP